MAQQELQWSCREDYEMAKLHTMWGLEELKV